MMKSLATILILLPLISWGQAKQVEEKVKVNGQDLLILDLDFADDIVISKWDKQEVLVSAEVTINDGEDNDIFSMESSTSESTVYVSMDKNMWKKIDKKGNHCYTEAEINYHVFLPENLEVSSNSISGSYEVTYFDQVLDLKTISGVIDLTIPKKSNFDFEAKTISGEVFSDVEIEFPNGKEGLRQIVGQDFEGRIGKGGKTSSFETISGNIYLRKE